MLILFHCLIIASNVHSFKLDKIIENGFRIIYIILIIIYEQNTKPIHNFKCRTTEIKGPLHTQAQNSLGTYASMYAFCFWCQCLGTVPGYHVRENDQSFYFFKFENIMLLAKFSFRHLDMVQDF